jgi:hypothetical protein
MNIPLIVAILLISAPPVYAQDQQPDAAKLKADAQKVVSIIKGDKAASWTSFVVSAKGPMARPRVSLVTVYGIFASSHRLSTDHTSITLYNFL